LPLHPDQLCGLHCLLPKGYQGPFGRE